MLILRKRVMYVIIAVLAALGMLWALVTAQVATSAQVSLDDSLLLNSDFVTSPTNLECVREVSLTLAAYQAWFGLDSHIKPPPYVSTDTAVISGHIAAALARGIDGFVVDWYGPEASVLNGQDRKFIDEATAKLLQQAEGQGFYVALKYDEGTVLAAETLTTAYTTRVISDLLYAKRYFTMPAYLKAFDHPTFSFEHPALFVFPYPTVDPYIDWAQVRNQLGITVTLFDKDPDPTDPAHDALFDGFYAWVNPTTGDGTEWGEGYLTWFYNTMATPTYSHKVTIGGVWPGFDDSLASWGTGRYIWRRCGQTWCDTWDIAGQYNPPIVMIETWNDFEEGTDVEYGTGECLAPSQEKCALAGENIVYTHALTNTGKFTDTFSVRARSSNAWPAAVSPVSITLGCHAWTTLAITLTVPETAGVGTQDMLVITATSTLSTAVQSSVVNTTTVRDFCDYCFLPIVLCGQRQWEPVAGVLCLP
jgi:hypothetical protein